MTHREVHFTLPKVTDGKDNGTKKDVLKTPTEFDKEGLDKTKGDNALHQEVHFALPGDDGFKKDASKTHVESAKQGLHKKERDKALHQEVHIALPGAINASENGSKKCVLQKPTESVEQSLNKDVRDKAVHRAVHFVLPEFIDASDSTSTKDGLKTPAEAVMEERQVLSTNSVHCSDEHDLLFKGKMPNLRVTVNENVPMPQCSDSQFGKPKLGRHVRVEIVGDNQYAEISVGKINIDALVEQLSKKKI